VSARVGGGDEVTDAVDADDHADALPDLGIVGVRDAGEIEQQVWERDDDGAPEEIVKTGGQQPENGPTRSQG